MVHWDGEQPGPGDFLVTEAGSGYEVVAWHADPDTGKGPVDTVKIEPTSIPSDARVFPMVWVPRG